jgi:hypothetical protein
MNKQLLQVLMDRLNQTGNDAVLKLIYLSNPACPPEITQIVKNVIDNKISRTEAKQQILQWMDQ